MPTAARTLSHGPPVPASLLSSFLQTNPKFVTEVGRRPMDTTTCKRTGGMFHAIRSFGVLSMKGGCSDARAMRGLKFLT